MIVTSDSGSCANWYARDLKVRAGMMMSLSGGLASMGAAVPYAIGAKFAHPERPVIALVGDGAMQMNNMAELITVAKYWRKWSNPQWICCVWVNDDLNQVTWEQRVMEGFPKLESTQDIPDLRYDRFAELIGLKGIYVDDPERMGTAWDEALAATMPVIINVRTGSRRGHPCPRTSASNRPSSSCILCSRAIPTRRTSSRMPSPRSSPRRLVSTAHRRRQASAVGRTPVGASQPATRSSAR